MSVPGQDVALADHLPVAIPDNTGAPAAPAPHQMPDDPDDRAVAEARAAVDAQAGGRQADAPLVPRQPGAAPIMVPKDRFDAARRRAKSLEEENAYLKGALHARTQMAGAAPAPATAAARPAQQVAPNFDQLIAVEQNRIGLASQQFDQGQITMTQLNEVRTKADNVIANLRAQAIMQAVQSRMPSAPQLGPSDQAVMQQQLVDLETAFPAVKALSERELGWIADVAKQEQAALGRPVGSGPTETMRLRQLVAEQAAHFHRRWYPNAYQTQQPTPIQRQPQQRGTSQPTASVFSNRANQALAKQALAANHPPDPTQIGTAGSPDVITEEDINRMSTEEIVALPSAVRARFLTSTG